MEPEQHGITVAATGEAVEFSREECERHLYIVGKSGSGKSTVLHHLAARDIRQGAGVAVIDPHGDLAEGVADCVPPSRLNDVCYLDVGDTERPVGFNPLASVPPQRHALAASGIVSAFRNLWSESWGPRLEYFLFHGLMALLASGRATLIDLPRLYTDQDFRDRVVARVSDPEAHRFWHSEWPSYDTRFLADATAPILNKAGQFAASPQLRAILGQTSPKFSLQYAMDHHKIFIANLSRGRFGEKESNLLGSLLVAHLEFLAMGRSNIPRERRVPFYAHIDEIQSFTTDSFAALLSESRKYALHLSLANQYTDRLSPAVRAAIIGNVGSMMVFRVGSADAEFLAPEFYPLPAHVLADQEPFTAWLRRLNGTHRPVKIGPPSSTGKSSLEIIRRQSRRHFGRRIT